VSGAGKLLLLAGVVRSDSEAGIDLRHSIRATHGELRAEPVDVLFLNGCHVHVSKLHTAQSRTSLFLHIVQFFFS
jgi:hypothetical protein